MICRRRPLGQSLDGVYDAAQPLERGPRDAARGRVGGAASSQARSRFPKPVLGRLRSGGPVDGCTGGGGAIEARWGAGGVDRDDFCARPGVSGKKAVARLYK